MPPAGTVNNYPDQVERTIVPSLDVFANRPGEFRFRSVSANSAGAGVDIDFFMEQPQPGRIQIPIMLVVGNTGGAAAVTFTVTRVGAAGDQDPWGRWDSMGATIPFYDAFQAAQNIGGRLCVPPYVHRTQNLRVRAIAPPGGQTVAVHYDFIDAPGELVQLTSLAATLAVR